MRWWLFKNTWFFCHRSSRRPPFHSATLGHIITKRLEIESGPLTSHMLYWIGRCDMFRVRYIATSLHSTQSLHGWQSVGLSILRDYMQRPCEMERERKKKRRQEKENSIHFQRRAYTPIHSHAHTYTVSEWTRRTEKKLLLLLWWIIYDGLTAHTHTLDVES